VVLWRGSPAGELEPTAAHRLGIDIGDWWRSPMKVNVQENPQWPSDPPEIIA
jgi:hypothetical protein